MDYADMLFSFVGGLGLFLYGIMLLSGGMQKAAGNKIKNLLKRFTDTPVKGVFVGFSVTAVIQSSSITTVTVVSLINSGLMTLAQSVGVIFGAEIGTTVTAQLVAFPVGKFAMPIIALGAFVYLVRDRHNGYLGQILLGFGLLFLGMQTMKHGVSPLKESEYFLSMLVEFGAVPVLGVIASALFTSIIQSSSATTAIIIAMGQENLLGLEQAIPLVLGANIGTCVTALIASYGATKSAKRAAYIHLLFNVAGVMIFLPFLPFFGSIVSGTSSDIPRQIANAHTIFNVTNTLLFLPFVPVFIYMAKRIVPGKELATDGGVKYLDDKYLAVPSIALDCVEKEVNRMAKVSLGMLNASAKVVLEGRKELSDNIVRDEEVVDNLLGAIGAYSVKLSQKQLSRHDARRIAAFMHNITDIERVADHSINLLEDAQKKEKENIRFSSKAREELRVMFSDSISIYRRAVTAVKTGDKKMAESVAKLEDVIDANERKFEENHIKRLKRKVCNPAAGIIFTDILHNLERIGDHSVNIVDRID